MALQPSQNISSVLGFMTLNTRERRLATLG